MRGATATLLVVLLMLSVTLVFVGCRDEATTEAPAGDPSAVPDGHSEDDGHDHGSETADAGDQAALPEQDDEDPEGPPPGGGPAGGAAGIIPLLESSKPEDNMLGVTQMQQMQNPDEVAACKDALRALIEREGVPAEALAGAISIWAGWAAEDPAPILARADDTHPGVRASVAHALQHSPTAASRDVLERLKQDPDSAIAAAAASSLGAVLAKLGDPDSIRALIAELGQPTGDRSAQAAMQLEQRGRADRGVIDFLIVALQTNPNPAARASCATIMAMNCAGSSPGQLAFAGTINAVYRAVSALDDAYTKPVPALIEALANDEDPVVREACAQALGTIGAEDAAEALGKALSDTDPHVRRRAASALIIVPSESVLDELIDTARHDKAPAVRRFAVEAISNQDGNMKDAAMAVAMCLTDPNPEVRRYAAEVLGNIGTQLEAPELLKLFDDPNEDVRWKAVQAMAKMAYPDAQDAFEDALWDQSPRVALAATRGLHKLGVAKAPPGRDEIEMRRRAMEAKARESAEDAAIDSGDEVPDASDEPAGDDS